MDLEFHHNQPQDFPDVSTLQQACGIDIWPQEILKNFLSAEIKNGSRHLITCRNQTTFCGFILFSCIWEQGELLSIAVVRNFRKKGIGSALLEHMQTILDETKVKQITLEVAENNTEAIDFYNKYGFNKVSERNQYYSTPRKKVTGSKRKAGRRKSALILLKQTD